MTIPRLTAAACGLAAIAVPAAQAQEPQAVSAERAISPISANGAGWAAWSRFDPAANTYSLVASFRGGPPEAVPVPPRTAPFDVDLGPNTAGGGPVAVYSRCADDGARKGCDIYSFTFADRTERKLPASSPTASDYMPSVWNGSVAFARRYEQRSGVRGKYVYTYVRSRSGTRRLPDLPRGDYRLGDVVSMDLQGRRVVVNWNRSLKGAGRSELWTLTVGGRRERLDLQVTTRGAASAHNVLGPSLAGRIVQWARTEFGDSDRSTVVRRDLRSGDQGSFPGPDSLYAHAYDSDVTWTGRVVNGLAEGPACGIQDPPGADPFPANCLVERRVLGMRIGGS